jgi:acetate kinase
MLNAGSSSLKYQVFAADGLDCLHKGQVAANADGVSHEDALRAVITEITHHADWHINAFGHRIVHGGQEFDRATYLTRDVMVQLRRLIALAPLHQPHNLHAVDVVRDLLPDAQQIGCFDTAFHSGHAPLFTHFAIPQSLYDEGVRRYGFHGLSYQWIAQCLKTERPDLFGRRIVVAHLGNGASVCALHNGKSIDTSMGFSALDGLMMGTRSGAIDAGVLLYLMREKGMRDKDLEHFLYHDCGLKGVSGLSHDVKTLLASNDPRAAFALDLFALKCAHFVAQMAVSMGGIDAVVFTGGIGEHAAPVREKIRQRLAFLGDLAILVIPTNEEAMMAQWVKQIIKEQPHE